MAGGKQFITVPPDEQHGTCSFDGSYIVTFTFANGATQQRVFFTPSGKFKDTVIYLDAVGFTDDI